MTNDGTKMPKPMSKEEMIDTLKGLVFGTFDRTTAKEREALDMAIKALEQTTWIPVSERLPEPNVAVLTYINTGATETYCLAYWNDRCEAWEEWIGIDLIEKDKGYKVMAWRELPEPY